MLKISGEAYKL